MEQYVTDPHLIEMLRNGPKSSTQAHAIGAMKKRYKKIMGIDDEPKDPKQYASY